MKKYLILSVVVCVIVASCSKKTTPAASKEDMLRSGRWSVASGTVTFRKPSGFDTTVNYMNFLPKCRQDDYMVFHNGTDAAIFTGSNKCSPADPDSATFLWNFGNDFATLSMYNGFDFIYGIADSVLPFRFDTLSQYPILVLDTIHGILDTEFSYTRIVPILDTIWNLRFDSLNLHYNNLYNAKVIDFTESSFTLNFWVYGSYPDTSGHHTGIFIRTDVSPGPDTLDWPVIYKPDTLKYSITYKKS
mgnify:CR=1 FL=1